MSRRQVRRSVLSGRTDVGIGGSSMPLEDHPGYLGLTSEGVIAIHADWPIYPIEHGLGATVTSLGAFLRISGETDHPFRLNPTTCFGGIRPGISVESDHLFR
jgi:hypothetical protein